PIFIVRVTGACPRQGGAGSPPPGRTVPRRAGVRRRPSSSAPGSAARRGQAPSAGAFDQSQDGAADRGRKRRPSVEDSGQVGVGHRGKHGAVGGRFRAALCKPACKPGPPLAGALVRQGVKFCILPPPEPKVPRSNRGGDTREQRTYGATFFTSHQT